MQQGNLHSNLNKDSFFEKYIGILLLLLTLIVGLLTYKSYGIAWDEPTQHTIGQTSYNYALYGDKTLLNSGDNIYGVAFEIPLIVIEKIFHLKDTRDIYLMRHLITHFFFLFSAFIFFLLIDYLYKNKLMAAIGFLLLVLNPLIYGHSFFNSKDVPFLSLFIICFLLAALAFNRKTYRHFVLLGAGCGLLTDIRIMGILLIGCICLFFMIDFIAQRKDKKQSRKTLNLFFTFIGITLLTIYIAWPYLWLNPVHHFIDAFRGMAKFNSWLGEIMFNGRIISPSHLPWNYSITCFLISNPVIYLVLGICGILFFVFNFCKNYKLFLFNAKERNNLLYLLCFITPFLSVIILHSVVYDSWRQLYFVYPSFILLAIYGLSKLVMTRAKTVVLAIVVIGLGLTGAFMITNYPFEHVYFNQFVPSDKPEYLRRNWELDYWGTSFKQGFEYILKNDTSSNINIGVSNPPGISNPMILKPEDRKRIHIVEDLDSASYFITIYRYHHNDYRYTPSQVCYSIKVLHSSILTVFKLK